MLTWPARRLSVLPPAQLSAATSTMARPLTVVVPSVWVAIRTMPPVASSKASHWNGRSFSPVIAIDRPMVKNTWTWITSDARPGEMSCCIARYSKPN